MTAGFNLRVDIYRRNRTVVDDEVGGMSQVEETPTIHLENLSARYMEFQDIPSRFGGQGIQSEMISAFLVRTTNTDIYPNDIIELTYPLNHPWYGNKYRIEDVTQTSFSPTDSRRYLRLRVSRSDIAHGSV